MLRYVPRLVFISFSLLLTAFQFPCWAQSAPTYGNIAVDRLGATNYNLAINALDGVGGVNPNISVTYNSQAKNGLMGKGGAIKGLSFIARCQQTLARDGVSKAISWSADDRFCIDGQRLILTAGTQGAAESQYHTEIDNGVVYTAKGGMTSDPDYFEARAKDGSILTFGGASNAKDYGGATKTWALSRFQSREKNNIEYVYEGGSDSGLRIKRINYAFPMPDTVTGANAYIEFEYKDRDDLLSQYVSGYEFRTTKVLNKINSYGAAGVLYRSYVFDIVASTALAGEVSRWQSVKECISLSNCFGAINFSWGRTTQNTSNITETKGITVDFLGTMARNFSPTKAPQLSAKNCAWCVSKAVDLNGNGIAEFIWTDETETGTYRIATSFDGAILPYESIKKAQPVSNSSYDSSSVQSIPSPEFGDMDADGFVDVLTPLRPNTTSNYSTYFWWLGGVARSETYWRVAGAGSLSTMEFIKVLDLDSDGFQELVTFNSKSLDLKVSKIKKKQVTNGFQYYLDDNTNSAVSYHLSDYPARLPLKSMVQIAPSSAAVGDFDGDGNEDLLLYMLEADLGTKQQTQKIKWYSKVGAELLYKGTIAQWTQNSLSLASSAPDTNGDIIVDFVGLSKFTPIDINGDGLVDIAFKQFSSKSWMYAINTGNGFLPLETLALPSRASNADSDTFVDVNNDGYADFVYSGTVSGSSTLNIFVKYWNAKLNKFSDPVSVRQTTRNPVLYADMNGDGYADFVEFSSSDNSINVYGFTNNAGSVAGGYQGVIAQDAITSVKEGTSLTTDIEYQTLIKPGKVVEQTCKIGSGNTTVPCQDLQSTSQYTPLQIKITHPTAGTLEGDSMDSSEYYAKTNDPFAIYGNPLVGSARVSQYVAPLPIVTHVTSTAAAIVSDKKYFYSVMRTQAGGRGLLGFEKTWVEDQLTGLKTETQWRQDWPFTGMESVKLLWNKYGVAISEDENTLVVPAGDFSGVLSPTIRKTIHKQYSTSLADTKQGALVSANEIGGYFSYTSSSTSSSSSSSIGDVSALQLMLPEEGNITKAGFSVAQGLSAALITSDGQVLKDINGIVPRVKYYVDNYVLVAEGNADGTVTTWTPDVPGTYSVQAKVVLPNGKELSSKVAGLIAAGQSGYPSITFTNLLRNGNTYLTNATMNLYANAVDADGTIASVTFYANNTVIATKTAPTVTGGIQYRYDWVPTVAGTYKIKAVAKDNSNNTTSTKTIEVFVGVVPSSSSSSSASSQIYPALTMPVPSSEQKVVFGDMTSLSTQIIGSDSKQWAEADQSIPDAKFFANNQYLGKSKASGLGFNWTPGLGGVYEVVAASLLQNGNQVVSPSGALIVKNDNAPFVNLTAPKYGGTSYRLNELVLASATAESAITATAISKLTFYANDVEIYTDTSAPYALAWSPPAAGTYDIKAVAVDAAGNVGVSAIRRIQYGMSSMSGSSSSANYFTSSSVSSSSSSVATNATIELSYPRVNKYENFGLGAEVILVSYVWASGNIEWLDANGQLAQVDYYANGQLLTGLRADERGHVKYWTPPATGVYAIKAVAHVDNNKTIESGIGNFFIRSANAPIITLNTPSKNTAIKIGSSLQLDATVTDPDNDLAMVRFYVNDQELLLNPLVKPPFTASWTPPVIGNYSIKVEAMDDSGVKAISPIITVSVVEPGFSPTVSIVSPANGGSVPFGNSMDISAVATDLDGTISKVEFYVNDQLISTDFSFPYAASYTPTAAGIYSIKAIAYDNLGNTGSIVNSIQYGLAAPVVSVVDPDEDCFIGVNLNPPENVASNLQYELYERADGQAWAQTPTVIKSGSAGDLLPYIAFFSNHAVGKFDYRARVCPVGNSAACSAYSSVVSNTIDSSCGTAIHPTVALVNPPSSVQLGQTVTLTATVGGTTAIFNAVRFYFGNTEIGVDYSSPFTINWTPTVAGRAYLYAKDDAGNDATGVSNLVAVEVVGPSSSSSSSSSINSSTGAVVSSDGNSSGGATSPNGGGNVSSVAVSSSSGTITDPSSPILATAPDMFPGIDVARELPAEFDVTSAGQATYTIPILVGKGTAGFAPDISLRYTSGGANGVAGLGWSLSAYSAITRCRQTQGVDNDAKPITWSAEDRFCLNGERLLLVSGTYGGTGSQYKTELDSFVLVTAIGGVSGTPASFKVEYKNGVTESYGDVSDSDNSRDQLSTANSNSILTWALSKRQDSAGNKIIYTYIKDADGQRIDNIAFAYGDSSLSGAHVKFEYDDREDSISGYVAGYGYKTGKRLSKIKSYNGTQELRTYTLTYNQSSAATTDDKLSRVNKIQECVGDICSPATEFEWQVPHYQLALSSSSKILDGGVSAHVLGDINGDGLQDIAWYEEAVPTTVPSATDQIKPRAVHYALGSIAADGTFQFQLATFDNGSTSGPLVTGRTLEFEDVNGDGRMDLIVSNYSDVSQFTYNFVLLSTPMPDGSWKLSGTSQSWGGAGPGSIVHTDVDGDGFVDKVWWAAGDMPWDTELLGSDESPYPVEPLLYSAVSLYSENTSHPLHHILADPSIKTGMYFEVQGTADYSNMIDSAPIHSFSQLTGDFNGDGRMDLVAYPYNAYEGCTYTDEWMRRCFSTSANVTAIYTFSQAADKDFELHYYSRHDGLGEAWGMVTDFNNDGLSDFFTPDLQGNWVIQLNNGHSFNSNVSVGISAGLFNLPAQENTESTLADVNGDGYRDFVWQEPDNTNNLQGPSTLKVKYWDISNNQFEAETKILGSQPYSILFSDVAWYQSTQFKYKTERFNLMDVNSDGIPDMVMTPTPQSKSGSITVRLGKNGNDRAASNKIVAIKTGLGNRKDIHYEHIAASQNYSRISGIQTGSSTKSQCEMVVRNQGYSDAYTENECWDVPVATIDATKFYQAINDPWYELASEEQSLRPASPVLESIGAIAVVTGVDTSAPSANQTLPQNIDTAATVKRSYFYGQARMQAGGRGFLGFKTFTEFNRETGVRVETEYRQDWPYQGKVRKTKTYTADGHLLSEQENIFGLVNCYDDNSNLKAGCTDSLSEIISSQGTGALGSIQTFLRKSTTKTYALKENGAAQGDLLSTSVELNQYDDKGNLLKNNINVSSTLIDGYSKETVNAYKYTGSTWSMKQGRLERLTVTATNPAYGAITRVSSFEYYQSGAEIGLLKTETIEPDNNDFTLTTTHTYDKGNRITSATVGSGQTRKSEVEFDSLGRFVDKTYGFFTDGSNPDAAVKALVSEVISRDKYGTPTEVRAYSGTDYVTKITATTDFGAPYFTANSSGAATEMNMGTGADAYRICPADTKVWAVNKSITGTISIQCADLLGRERRKGSLSFDGTTWSLIDTEYDKLDRVVRTSAPYLSGTSDRYWTAQVSDILGRSVSVSSPYNGGYVTTTTVRDNLKTTITNPKSQVRVETSDLQGHVVNVQDPLNGNTKFAYDARGNMREMKDPLNNTTTLGYDLRDRKISMSDPDKGGWIYKYNTFGEITCQQDGNGQTSVIRYDIAGRTFSRIDRFAGGNCDNPTGDIEKYTKWTWDTATNGRGQLASVIDSATINGTVEYQQAYSYDSLGRAQATTTTMPGHLGVVSNHYEKVTYDQYGRLFQSFDAARANNSFNTNGIQNVYNPQGYLVQVVDAAVVNNSQHNYYKITAMNARGNVITAEYGNGVTQQADYYADTGLTHTLRADRLLGVNALQNTTLDWDEVGNLNWREERGAAGESQPRNIHEAFIYDSLNRLTNWNSSGDLTASEAAHFNNIDNITDKTGIGDYKYGVSCGATTNAGPHALCSAGGTTYAYDKNGNMLNDSVGRSMSYTTYDMPRDITKAGHKTAFSYGPSRARYKRVDTESGQTTTTLYVGSVEKVYYPDGTVQWKRNIAGVGLITQAVDTNGNKLAEAQRYLIKDHLGSLSLITDEIGAVEQSNYFDPWGKERKVVTAAGIKKWAADTTSFSLSAKPISTRGFTGHEQLAEVGLIHMNGRIYDGALGRFVQADPIIQDPMRVQSLNRYSYVWNNPLNATDPSGFSGSCVSQTEQQEAKGCDGSADRPEQKEGDQKKETPKDSGLRYKITDKKALDEWLKKNGKTMDDFTKSMTDKGISKAGFGDSGASVGGVYTTKGNQSSASVNQSGIDSDAAKETRILSNAYECMGMCHGNKGVTTNFLPDEDQKYLALGAVSTSTVLVVGAACGASVICGAVVGTAVFQATGDPADLAGLGGMTRVGRWMSPKEYNLMRNEEKVQESISTTTHVALPADPLAFIKQAKPGAYYVEFNVPTLSLKVTNEGWAKILGPQSLEGRAAVRKGLPAPQMPTAENIIHKATKL